MIFNMVGGGGGSSDLSSIIVEVESESVVTCTKGPIILTGRSNGTVRFDDLENGTWNLKATKNSMSADTTVNITKFQIYYVTMSYFTATIKVTFPTDATSVTCVNSSTTLSVPSGSLSSGSYTFTVHVKGNWTIMAKNASNTDTATVNVQAEQQYTASLSFLLVLFDGEDNTAVTGGWASSGTGGSASITGDNIVISASDSANSAKQRDFVTKNSILNLSKYKTVNIEVVNCAGDISMWVGTSGTGRTAEKRVMTKGTVSLDINAVSKDLKFGLTAFALSSEAPNSSATISKVWLIPKEA